MAYSLTFSIGLGSSNTGLTLKAQLVDQTGANVGASITSGFTEIGRGFYLWYSASIPNDHLGGVVFRNNADDTILSFVSITPRENEGVAKLASDGVDNIIVDGDVNLRQAVAVMASVLAGVLQQTNSTTITIKAINDPETTRVTATVNSADERLAITLNLPA